MLSFRAALLVVALTSCFVLGCGSSQAAAAPCAVPGTPNDGLDVLTDEQLAHKVLEVTGAANLGKQTISSMLDTLRKLPNLPPGFLDRMQRDIKIDELTALIVPIYLKHYDRPTLIAVIRFYQSPPGQKMITALPAVTAESTEAGKAWGEGVAKKALAESMGR